MLLINFPICTTTSEKTRNMIDMSKIPIVCTITIHHGLIYMWTELIYLSCPNEVALLTPVISQKLTQSY